MEFSVRSDRPLRVINEAPGGDANFECGVLWANLSGSQVVSSCGHTVGLTKRGRFTLWSSHSFWFKLQDPAFAW